jgi:hypothetical protein
LAEAKRIFKCKNLGNFDTNINEALKNANSFNDYNDIYYTYLLYTNAKSYDAKLTNANDFKTYLGSKLTTKFLDNFKDDDLTIDPKNKGL